MPSNPQPIKSSFLLHRVYIVHFISFVVTGVSVNACKRYTEANPIHLEEKSLSWEITSERLCLAPIQPEDAELLHLIWTDPQVRYFLWDDTIIPFEQTQAIVATSQTLFAQSGFGIWGIWEHGSNQANQANESKDLLGFAGYWHFRIPPVLELLFGVAPRHWGCGIATESSHRLIRYAFQDLGWAKVEASTDVENVRSIRVLEKLGLQSHKREVIEGLDTLFYQITRPDQE